VNIALPECTGRSLKRQYQLTSDSYKFDLRGSHILGVQSLAIGVNPRAMPPVEGAGFQVAEVQGTTINLQCG
jgi:hypothetical protein